MSRDLGREAEERSVDGESAVDHVATICMIIHTSGGGAMPSSREILKRLRADGWVLAAVSGSHHQFKHPVKPGKVTVPHPRKDLSPGTVRSILRQAGLQ